MTEAVLGLGTNLNNKEDNIKNAIKAIVNLPKTKFMKVSNFYETNPFDVPNIEDNYINCCVKIITNLTPNTLLGTCLGIESAMGRTRPFYHASRIIDIDLIIYGDYKINSNDLILPHPEFSKRLFVLEPLLDLYPNGIILGLNFKNYLLKLKNN